ncbi:MAG: ATP synthase subunit C [Nitrosomonas sp.]|jgi:V/A-type H+-transporting ATPase subunit K|nr:ATP synthase subunit C [Nitrosomonas sp.]MCP5250464.1 ATP synthase subunit C [Burkholderiales bacterium]MCP5291928.1 ATP synthase subunit C [Burkholderiales bacterium]MDR4651063.1 ATP synthase subunit C [Nitrosomonas sp.]
MSEFMVMLGWLGLYAPMALSAVGSIIGCAVAGQAAIGAMLETESGHGRYLGVSAMPSSQIIYGIVVMLTLNREMTETSAAGIFGIGLLSGIALLASAVYQGRSCAAAINAAKAKPEIFGLSLAPAAIVEGFAVFAFIFALVISAGIPV